MDAWLLKAGEEKQIRFQDDPRDFDSNPIGPIAISDNYMVPVLFCPHTNYFQDRKGFRITVIKNGHYGYGAWPISDDMYPSTLIQAAHVNFTALECYNLLLLEQKIRSLWISKCEAYQPRKYYPLITSDEMELKSFAVQAIRRNNRDILSITGTAYNHPGKIYHSFCDPQNEKNLNMIPIADNVLTYHDCVNAQHEHLIYYTSKNKDTKILELHRLSYDSLDDEWQDEPSVVGYGTWFVCLFNLIIDFGTMCCSSPKGNRVLDSVTSVIGFIMGLAYTAFDICNWVMAGIKDTMLFINEIIICLQSIGRILILPAFIKASKFTTQVAAVVLDMLACTTGIIKFSVNIQKLQMLDIQ